MKTNILIAAATPLLFGAGSASANLLHELIAVRGGLETIQVERHLDEQLFNAADACRDAGGQPRELKASAAGAEVTRALDCAIGQQKSYVLELAGARGKYKDASLTLTMRAPLQERDIGLIESALFEAGRDMGIPDSECTSSIDAAAGLSTLQCRGAATTAAYAAVSAVRWAPWTEAARAAKAQREKAFEVAPQGAKRGQE